MQLNLPPLEVNRIYRRAEVEDFIGDQDGSSDFDIVSIQFPRCLETFHHDGQSWRDGEEILLQYRVYSMADFRDQVAGSAETFSAHEEHQRRIEVIVGAIASGEPVFPLWLQKMTHAVALSKAGIVQSPTYGLGARNYRCF